MRSFAARTLRRVLAVVVVLWIPVVALQAAPADEKKPQPTLRRGAIPRPNIAAPRPVAQHRTLQVKQFSGDFTRWVDRMTLTERRKLTFRWKNIRGSISNPRWQVTTSPNAPLRLRGGHIGEGRVPRLPAKGSYAVFNIDLTHILPPSPPAGARKYYVRIVVSERARPDYVDSRPVVLTYQQPSQEVTQFTEEGLRTTPPKKVAPPGDRRYSYPKIMGVHMDWCKRWASECGEPAANEFCRREGYRRAKHFSKTSHTTMGVCEGGKCKTRIISSYQICHNPTCRAFFHITCTHDRKCETKSLMLKTERKKCSWDETLIVKSKKGDVSVPWVPKQTNTIPGIPVTPQFNWYCGGKKESFSCPSGTTEVDVSRWAVKYKEQKDVEFKCRKVYQVCKD